MSTSKDIKINIQDHTKGDTKRLASPTAETPWAPSKPTEESTTGESTITWSPYVGMQLQDNNGAFLEGKFWSPARTLADEIKENYYYYTETKKNWEERQQKDPLWGDMSQKKMIEEANKEINPDEEANDRSNHGGGGVPYSGPLPKDGPTKTRNNDGKLSN